MNPAILTAAGILVPQLIRLAEVFYADKEKSGDAKKAAVVEPFHALVKTLPISGAPGKDELSALVEGTFQQMKASGSIAGELPAARVQTLQITSTGELRIQVL